MYISSTMNQREAKLFLEANSKYLTQSGGKKPMEEWEEISQDGTEPQDSVEEGIDGNNDFELTSQCPPRH